jgi:hypothetical protein
MTGDDTVVVGSLRDWFGVVLRLQPPLVLRRREEDGQGVWVEEDLRLGLDEPLDLDALREWVRRVLWSDCCACPDPRYFALADVLWSRAAIAESPATGGFMLGERWRAFLQRVASGEPEPCAPEVPSRLAPLPGPATLLEGHGLRVIFDPPWPVPPALAEIAEAPDALLSALVYGAGAPAAPPRTIFDAGLVTPEMVRYVAALAEDLWRHVRTIEDVSSGWTWRGSDYRRLQRERNRQRQAALS